MDSEIGSMLQNNTWTLADLPPDCKAVTCKWLLREKYNPDGTVARFKSRLVACRFFQTPGLDYFETFSPILRMESLRKLLALAVHYNFHEHEMDVKTIFLNGKLSEETYMKQPPYYESREYPTKVCKLNKSNYDLKQSSRQWYQKFNQFMISHGFSRFNFDDNMYLRIGKCYLLLVSIYVDEIILVSGLMDAILAPKTEFSKAFFMIDMGELKYILKIEIQHDGENNILRLNQRPSAKLLLKRFHMESSRGIETPLPVINCIFALNGHESLSEQQIISEIPYSNAIEEFATL
ncbi:hypothetical protein L7F22_029171 [Adiantum nelumboides]|nr:hypothetical protein [Adiantum nelumboides]